MNDPGSIFFSSGGNAFKDLFLRLDPLQFDPEELPAPERRKMRVRVDEPGRDGFPLEVDDGGVRSGKGLDLVRRADSENPASADRNRLGDGILGIDGNDTAVHQDHLRAREGSLDLGETAQEAGRRNG